MGRSSKQNWTIPRTIHPVPTSIAIDGVRSERDGDGDGGGDDDDEVEEETREVKECRNHQKWSSFRKCDGKYIIKSDLTPCSFNDQT